MINIWLEGFSVGLKFTLSLILFPITLLGLIVDKLRRM
jgi:hypothetical protein